VINDAVVLVRRDTIDNWLNENPILRYKELVCVIANSGDLLYKLGDGETPYCDLPYIKLISSLDFINFYTKSPAGNDVQISICLKPELCNKIIEKNK
jgi:hypothetical protein